MILCWLHEGNGENSPKSQKWKVLLSQCTNKFSFFLCYILPKNAHKMHIWNPKTVESESNSKWFCVKGRKIRRIWSKITKIKSTTFTRHQLIFFFVRYILHRIAHKMHTWNPEIVHCESNAEWFCVGWMKGTAKMVQNHKNEKYYFHNAPINFLFLC